MKVALVGSRKFNDIKRMLDNIPPETSEIVSGGANGADSVAEDCARVLGIPKKIFLPKFKTDPSVKYHVSHFHVRNRQIVEYADIVIAFMPHGGSRGTQSTINHAKKTGKPFRVIYF